MAGGMKQQQAYALYKANTPLTQIATTVGVSRQTISNWRKKYNWDQEMLLDATSSEEMRSQEQRFVAMLIREFEKGLDALGEADAPKQLALIEKYTRTYFRLKAGDGDCRLAKEKLTREVAYKTIQEIAAIALEHHASDVAEFLSAHADEIVTLVRQ